MQITTVYRMNIGSDSKPATLENLRNVLRVKEHSKDYVVKYPDFEQSTVVNMLLDKDCSSEVEIFKRDLEVTRLSQLTSHLREISDNQNQYIEN